MRHRAAALCMGVGMTLVTSSCDPTTAVAVPVLVITATWHVEGQEGRRFSFSALQEEGDGLESGTFEGFEVVDATESFYDFTGSWENGQIWMTVERGGVGVPYTATFQQNRPTRLTFHSAHETIVLVPPPSD